MNPAEPRVAIVGMAGRFPSTGSLNEFWRKIVRDGHEGIEVYDAESDDEEAGAYAPLEGAGLFDNDFFDVSPAEARRMDPQHRLFLESVWEALEVAGIDITTYDGYASVYGSCSMNISYLREVLDAAEEEGTAGGFDLNIGNSRDYLATRVGYKLDLSGECMTVQTACSSSLVAAHLACESILSGQSDLAIAGGVSVRESLEPESRRGHSPQEGFILSPDGHCRPFTEAAEGTVSGDGVGVVVLKPLEHALEDRDEIFGVIDGTAINNDGQRKVGYTAPSVDGQVEVMEDALAVANVDRDEVGFIECHGTGTDLGDAIELRALRKVFEDEIGEGRAPLYLGSIKANIGHLDAGAGITGLIKATLAVYNEVIPPLLHADEHAPHDLVADSEILELPESRRDWEIEGDHPRRAAVSSLGIGGTNAHVVLREGPKRDHGRDSEHERPSSCLVWSAKTETALDTMTSDLASAFHFNEDLELQDVAYTLQRGRTRFDRRRCLVASDVSEAISGLRSGRYEPIPETVLDSPAKTAFLFSGYGPQSPGMGRELLDADPELREQLERCDDVINQWTDLDLIGYLTDEGAETDGLHHGHTMCAVVAFEHALATRYIDWGCEPDVLIGSSLGEYPAACLAGVLSLEDMLQLVFRRGELMEQLIGGAMMLANTTWETLNEQFSVSEDLEEAIRVAPESVIVSGPEEAIAALDEQLEEQDVRHRRIPVEIAAHSAAIEEIREDFLEAASAVEFHEPEIPYISNLTGQPATGDLVGSPDYWYEQMRNTVQFQTGMEALYEQGARYFLEVGPGRGLSKFCEWNFPDRDDVITRASMSHAESDDHDWSTVAEAVGTAWMCGAEIDWDAFDDRGSRQPLPTYPFEQSFFHIDDDHPMRPAEEELEAQAAEAADGGRKADVDRTLPRNPLEEQIADVWSHVLGVDEIGIDENFFDLGGDSLMATRVVGRIQTEITPDISIEDVMEHRTIREMADVVESILDEGAGEGETTDEADHYCVFELELAGETSKVKMSRDEYEEQGVPDGAENVRFPGEDHYCVFELELAGETTKVKMSRDEYEEQGVPDGAENVRFPGEDGDDGD